MGFNIEKHWDGRQQNDYKKHHVSITISNISELDLDNNTSEIHLDDNISELHIDDNINE